VSDKTRQRKKAEKEEKGGEDKSSDEEESDVMFKVKLNSPHPEEVKISSKNVCLVTIVKG
jgi:hypothetical protein